MKFRYLYLFLLICIIILPLFSQYQYSKTIFEGINSDNKNDNIVLIGDSILKNNYYVGNDKSVEEIFYRKTNTRAICYAINDSKIYDIYSQVNRIPLELNNSKTTIFISAGGNDILEKYVERNNQDLHDFDGLNTFLNSYKKLIETIKHKMDKCRIVILDVYYPTSTYYLPYKDIIKEWNNKLYNYAEEQKIDILQISDILTDSKDFIFDIEPSEIGGDKLVDAIIKILKNNMLI
jgi:hypothetical protein